MKLVHKDLRFFFPLWKQRIEILLCHKCVCIQIPWTVLFLFADRTFLFHTPIFPFLHRTMVWSASRGFLLPCRMSLQTHPQCLPALLEDMISPGSVFTYFTSCVWWECVKWCSHAFNLLFFFLLVCLLTAHVAWLECKRFRRARESMHSGDLCAVNRLDMPYESSQEIDLCVPSSTSWYHELLEARVRGLSVLRSWKISEI